MASGQNPPAHPPLDPNDPKRIDPQTGLPLPDPYTEYLTCPHCGAPEVEVFCYQTETTCQVCGKSFSHTPPPTCGTFPFCKRGKPTTD